MGRGMKCLCGISCTSEIRRVPAGRPSNPSASSEAIDALPTDSVMKLGIEIRTCGYDYRTGACSAGKLNAKYPMQDLERGHNSPGTNTPSG